MTTNFDDLVRRKAAILAVIDSLDLPPTQADLSDEPALRISRRGRTLAVRGARAGWQERRKAWAGPNKRAALGDCQTVA